MMDEMYLLHSLFRGGSVLIQATVFAGLLLVLVFRPERLRHKSLFLLAAIFMVLSMVVPPFSYFLATVMGSGLSRGPMMRTAEPFTLVATNVAGPMFLGLSVLFALLSLMPRTSRPFQPPQHPLE
jgi:hypothetical protein